jgi:hypothetical protein
MSIKPADWHKYLTEKELAELQAAGELRNNAARVFNATRKRLMDRAVARKRRGAKPREADDD